MTEEQTPEEQTLAQKNIERMDTICQNLLDLIEKETTPDKLKPVLFTQCMNWQKMRDRLLPAGNGNRLKEMSENVKSGKRNGSAKRGPYRTKDGAKIRAIIDSLPAYGSGIRRDTEDPERSGVGNAVDAGGIPPNGSGHVSANDDGIGDLS